MMSKIKEKLSKFFRMPSLFLTPKQTEEFIESFVQKVSQLGIEKPALMFIGTILPVSPLLSQMTLLPIVPFLELIGLKGYNYVAFFREIDNVKRLEQRLLELVD